MKRDHLVERLTKKFVECKRLPLSPEKTNVDTFLAMGDIATDSRDGFAAQHVNKVASHAN